MAGPALRDARDPFEGETPQEFRVSKYGLAAAIQGASVTPGAEVIVDKVEYSPGGIDITAMHNLSIRGDGKILLTNASNDLFTWTATTRGLRIHDIHIGADVVRTGGWVLKGNENPLAPAELVNASIENVTIRDQVNGFWFNRFAHVSVARCLLHAFAGTGGIGIKAGQASTVNEGISLYVTRTDITGFDRDVSSGSTPAYLSSAVRIEDADATYWTLCNFLGTMSDAVQLVAGSWGVHSHEFISCFADATKDGHCFSLTGTGVATSLKWIAGGAWSAGWKPPGTTNWATVSPTMHNIHLASTGLMRDITIKGVSIRNSSGSNIYISANECPAIIEGNRFSESGSSNTFADNHDIYINVPLNALAPTIKGNISESTIAPHIRTSATSNRVVIDDFSNIFPLGATYGVTPHGNGHLINSLYASSIDGRLFSKTSPTANSGAGETTVWSDTLKANSLSADGQSLDVELFFFSLTSNSPQVFRFYFGGTALQFNATSPTSGQVTRARVKVIRIGSASQRVYYESVVGATNQGVILTNTSHDMTLDITMSVTIQATASGDASLQTLYIRKESHA